MTTIRFKALGELLKREPKAVHFPSNKVTDYYGELVFNVESMRKYLSKEAFRAVMTANQKGLSVDRKMADGIAAGMKAWSIEKGATHYTHWFQPLTDGTAEKHDGFIDYGDGGHMIENFSGSLLAQQEPDASSFPSGGIRQTFEARGYTAWDVSSPAFIVGTTLCIPTIFISYTGEALDYKAPLLKALAAVDEAAVSVCQYFDKNVTKVHTNLGWEQEYFLIDEALYLARPDLVLTGRTLMGHSSSKDQQLDDHYFGSIPERVTAFMMELEVECHKLGIPVKTRHNEVAPNQFELAPIYEEANLANDHNQLVMDVMKKVARHHKFRVLFHEKPFAGINGSGKHNNWSLGTDTGVVLLAPGKNPKANIQFLTFVVNTLMAVYKNQDLLRASILTASNSHRLGANEAPPSIVSAFLGDEVSSMLDRIVEEVGERKMTPDEKTALKLGIGRIPEIILDNTDRNRTSPFAFTGNRFEFRAVGSSVNNAAAMTALSAAVAVELKEFKIAVDALIEQGIKKDEAIFQVLKKMIIECKPIRFNGDGYSEDWVVEAKKRGLTNITSVPESILKYLDPASKKSLIESGVMTEKELHARVEVELEKFTKKIQIEARVLGDLAINHIVPTAVAYQTKLIQNVQGLRDIFTNSEYEDLSGARKELIKEISVHISSIKAKVREMVDARKECNVLKEGMEMAVAYDEKVRPYLSSIRYHIDKLELVVDNEMWPLPKYRELLFNN
ncbi:glutamine synthetase type III [Labilibaculum sp. A4]|uniref:Glutamine synthetase type III n=1 Tax=Labilibaculum euxinus TaxID=2686357 RepID=A0A425Y4V0_9BACT|nr:glutamine synthetase III [Labilibaculum euxinus]MDQ1772257.1 glutamine synthetase III [Labilibaculum euxinus]MUP37070.1 glutamine synthetase type III [Labilibaculum euxinus]MVB06275.1 glutamine synthetase type III [Labilibaculum euxinus]MWN78045.1 glutamine synthetase type III [Labilibaculum euxinus]